MKKLVLLFIVGFFSCVSNNQKEEVKTVHNHSEKLIFPDSLISHIPKKDEFNSFFIEGIMSSNALEYRHEQFSNNAAQSEFFSYSYLQEYQIKKKLIIDSLHEKYKEMAIDLFVVSDTGYFIIDKERSLLQKYNEKSLHKTYVDKIDNYFILYFNIYPYERNWVDSSTICGLSKDFVIYILKRGNDAILEEQYLYEWDVLPDLIKHGYSSGVAISKEHLIILYWALAW